MAELALRAVTKTFGTMPVLHGIDLDIQSGEFVAFVRGLSWFSLRNAMFR